MATTDKLIMVVNHASQYANDLKELIEFMDAPQVRTAGPDDWQLALGKQRLEALFVGEDLNSSEIDDLVAAVGRLDPNVPIVMLSAGATR